MIRRSSLSAVLTTLALITFGLGGGRYASQAADPVPVIVDPTPAPERNSVFEETLHHAIEAFQSARDEIGLLRSEANRILEQTAAIVEPAPKPNTDPTPTPTPNPVPTPDPVPDGPLLSLPVSVHGDIGTFIKITAATTGKEVRWVAMDAGLNVFPAELLKASTSTVVIASQAGTYRLLAYTALADMASDPAICNVVVGTPTPPGPTPPGPTPPTPPAPPTPTAAKLWLVVIDDATTRTQQTGLLLGDVGFWRSLGHTWAMLDANNPAADAFKAQITQAGGLPALVVMNADTKKVLGAVKLPADKAGVSAVVATYSGKSK